MQICFGASVRRLRRERGLTQEQLAGRLNVAFQTVSKWERDESYPDLTMLPVIAGFFGVSADELLGVNEEENERRIREMLEGFDSSQKGEAAQQLPALKKALSEHPRDYRLWLRYMLCLLYNCHGLEDAQAAAREVREVYDRIDRDCGDDSLRMRARRVFVMHLHSLARPGGAPEMQVEAEELLRRMPDLRCAREHIAAMVTLPGEAHTRACQRLIPDLLWMLLHAIYHNEEYGNAFPGEPASFQRAGRIIEAEELQIKLIELICPEGDYGKNTHHMIYANSTLAVYSAVAGDYEKAFAALRRSAELAADSDARPTATVHTSFLLRGLPYDRRDDPSGNLNFRARLHMLYTERYPWPEEFKADPRFGEILALLG
jgi:transcriptional regulator with XRE-family HTH domain